MRFTASTQWGQLVSMAAKTVTWTAYTRTVTTLSTANNGTAGWTDVSNRIVLPLSDQTVSIEQDFLQFASSVVSISALDVAYWSGSIFTSADRLNPAKFFEFKLVCSLSLGSLVASDECITFSGWVNKDTIFYGENDDSVAFDVMSYDDMASLLPAESITTQYIENNVYGLVGTNLLSLYNILNAYVRDANVASYVLKVGVHKINYQYNGGAQQINLDGGPWQDSSAGSDFTLVNPDGTQKLRMYVPYWTWLPIPPVTGTSLNLTDSIIVTNPSGATLPRNWYRNATAYQVLGQCFNGIGITSQTYDTMEFPFWDGRTDISCLGIPPDDPTISTLATASCTKADGTIFVAVGLKIYQRAASAPYAYTLLCTFTGSVPIIRLLYNASSNYLWMVASNGECAYWDGANYHGRYAATIYGAYSCAVIANKNNVLVYVTGAGTLKQIDNAGTITTITVATYTPGYWLDSDGTSKIFFTTTSPTINMETWNGSSWVDNGNRSAVNSNFLQGVYSVADDAVYYEVNSGATWGVYCSKPISGGGGTTGIVTSPTFYILSEFFYNSGDSKVYFLADTVNKTLSPRPMFLYTVQLVTGTPTATALDTTYMPYLLGLPPWTGRSLGYGNSHLFGLNSISQLWQFFTSYCLSITEAAFPGGTIKDVLNGVCRACNLTYVVTPAKAASIYRRYDNAGSPVTSGSTLVLTKNEASVLGGQQTYVRAVVYFAVDNGVVKHWYNGSVFDTGSLGSDRVVTLQNTLVPSQLVKDTAYYGYTYLASDRWKYTLECGVYPAFQYEPFDGASLTFSGKIQASVSGVIYKSTYQSDGSLVLDVVV